MIGTCMGRRAAAAFQLFTKAASYPPDRAPSPAPCRSAPKALALVGFTGRPPPPTLASATAPEGGAAPPESGAAGPAAAAAQPGASLTHGGVPLGEFSYDMRGAHAVQTFQLSQVPPGLVVDHVRLLVRSNHGHPNFTCLYRLRMHGQPGSMPRAAAAATA